MPKNVSKQKGFTLVELAISILLLGIIAAGMSNLLIQGTRAIFAEKKIINADWQERIAFERMARDLRAIRSKVDISTASTNQLSFIDINGESIDYYLNNSKLMRNNQILAKGVQTLVFNYYDCDGNVTAQINAICYIEINIHITHDNTNFYFKMTIFPWGVA